MRHSSAVLLLLTLALGAAPTVQAQAVANDTLTIAVMATTDLHGHVLPWDYYADRPDERQGLAKVATLIDSVRAVHPHTLLLDAGDWLQGNPMAEYFATVDTLSRYPLMSAVDAMRYDAVVLGNHEFNFGIKLLNRRIVQIATPVIGANIYGHRTTEPAYVPYIIRDVGGVRVGILGLTTPGSAVWDRPHVDGRLDFGDGVDAAARFVPELRELGAEIVIVLAHSGLDGPTSYGNEALGEENFGRSIAEQVPGVDLLVLGHTHRPIAQLVEAVEHRHIGAIQAGRWGSHLAVGELDLVRDAITGEVTVVEQRLSTLPTALADSHPGIKALAADAHEAVRAHMNEPLATTSEPWPTHRSRLEPTAAIDLIHHVQLHTTGAQLSAAAAFTTDLTLGPGAITRGQIAQLYPYENMLFVLEITGADLRDYLEHSSQYYLPPAEPGGSPRVNLAWPGYNFDMIAGAEYVLDLSKPIGERVTELTYDARPVADEDVFTMAVNSYRAVGGGGFPGMTDEAVVRRLDRSVRNLIEGYLQDRGMIDPFEVEHSKWHLAPEPAGRHGER